MKNSLCALVLSSFLLLEFASAQSVVSGRVTDEYLDFRGLNFRPVNLKVQ